jgi:hypothetical protein
VSPSVHTKALTRATIKGRGVVTSIRRADRDDAAYAGFESDLDLDSLTFDWASKSASDIDVRGALTGVTIERTIEGASTLEVTLQDPDDVIFRGSRMWDPAHSTGSKKSAGTVVEYDYYGNAVDSPARRLRTMQVDLDGIVFRLVGLQRQGDTVTVQFEDRVIYWLRRKRGGFKLPRDQVTRAQFILRLLREISAERVPFVCPDLNVRQPIDSSDKMVDAKKKSPGADKSHTRGLGAAGLTVKGIRATAEQRRIGERCLAVADSLNAGSKASLALMEACIVESGIRNIPYGDSSSVGVLQLLNIHGSITTRLNVEWTVRQFLTKGFTGRGGAISIAKAHPGMSAGQVAQAVQGSAFPGRYDEVRIEAQRWVDAFSGTGATVSESNASGHGTGYKSYQFTREESEDSWTCMTRLATEVGWRVFMMGRSLFYMSEEDLYRRKPGFELDADDPGVLAFDYSLDLGKSVSEATAQVVAGRWKCPPGEPVLVTGYGPPDGRWLCTGWRRDYFSPVAEITLKQPGPELLEPSPQTESTDGGDASSATGLAESTRVMRAYRRAEAIDRKNQPYLWGGGHGSFNDPGGYDCSGFGSSCLHAGGMLDTPQSTVGLQSWGQPGKGKYMTLYVRETGNPRTSHTFLVFNLKGKSRYAEAGGSESSHTGWHNARSTSGFQPRHYPGT